MKKIIVVLAVSSSRDGQDMKRAIEADAADREEEVTVIVSTQVRELEGIPAHEFVMTEKFASQQSVMMLDAVRRTVLKMKPATS